MLASHDGALWVGTQDGVYRRAPGGAAFERVRLDDGRRLAGNINALVEGAGGIWVGEMCIRDRYSVIAPRKYFRETLRAAQTTFLRPNFAELR